MSADPWFRFFPDNWISGTDELTLEEEGAYIRLVARMYDRGGPIIDNDQRNAQDCRISTRRFRQIKESLFACGKLFLEDGLLFNEKAKKELFFRSKTKDKLRENARKGGENSARARKKTNEINKTEQADGEPNAQATAQATGAPIARDFHIHKDITTTVVEEAPRDPCDPVLCYSAGELATLKIEFQGTDIEARIRSYWAWCERRRIIKNEDRKSAFWSTLQKERGAGELVEAREKPPDVQASSALLNSPLLRAAGRR